MSRLAVLLMPWGRVGSNLVNAVVQRSKARKVWNEPLTGVQTRVIGAGGSLGDVWPAQRAWIEENLFENPGSIFLNVAANSVGDPAGFRDIVGPLDPSYIVLDREDDLATAVSALRTEAWVREGAEIGEQRSWSIPSGEAVTFRAHIPPDRLLAAYRIILKGRENIGIITEGRPTVRFTYEDLVARMPQVITAILEAADIPLYDFKVTTAKFGSNRLSDMVSNPDEVMRTAEEAGIATRTLA